MDGVVLAFLKGKIHFGRTGETDSPRGAQRSQTQGWSWRAGHHVPSHLGALREASSERQGFRGPGSKQGQALLRAQISGWSVSAGLVPATSFLPTTQLNTGSSLLPRRGPKMNNNGGVSTQHHGYRDFPAKNAQGNGPYTYALRLGNSLKRMSSYKRLQNMCTIYSI